jgi:DNA mismatch repair protein MutL
MGFELVPFGGSTWSLKTVPTALTGADVEGVVLDVLDELKEVGASNSADEVLDASLSCAACHTVVRANDRLGREEIAALLREMDQIDFGAHCPHGRPVFAEWSEQELARLFHRT